MLSSSLDEAEERADTLQRLIADTEACMRDQLVWPSSGPQKPKKVCTLQASGGASPKPVEIKAFVRGQPMRPRSGTQKLNKVCGVCAH